MSGIGTPSAQRRIMGRTRPGRSQPVRDHMEGIEGAGRGGFLGAGGAVELRGGEGGEPVAEGGGADGEVEEADGRVGAEADEGASVAGGEGEGAVDEGGEGFERGVARGRGWLVVHRSVSGKSAGSEACVTTTSMGARGIEAVG